MLLPPVDQNLAAAPPIYQDLEGVPTTAAFDFAVAAVVCAAQRAAKGVFTGNVSRNLPKQTCTVPYK